MKNGRKIFWGVLFLLGAIALIAGNMGFLQGIGFMSILFTIAGAGVLLEGIFHRNWATILFAAAFIAAINKKALGMEEVSNWALVGGAWLGSMGLGMLFPKKKNQYKKTYKKDKYLYISNNEENEKMDEEGGQNISFDVSFASEIKYINCQQLNKVNMDCSFGSLVVYLNEAEFQNHQAHVSLDCSFGGIELYVAKEWEVLINIDSSFGGVSYEGAPDSMGEDVLIIHGDVSFGGLKICYV